MKRRISPLVRRGLRDGTIRKQALAGVLMSSTDPEYLTFEEADRFIDYIKDVSVLSKMATIVKMTKDRKRIREIDFAGGFLQPGGCGTCVDTLDIEHSARWLIAEDIKGVAGICDDFIEDNLEGENFVDHLMQMIAKQIANELEMWAMMADTGGSYLPAWTNAAFMQLIDGWYQDGLANGHVLDATAAGDGRCITTCKLKEMIQALPAKYKQNRRDLVFVMSDNIAEDYTAYLQTTPGGADRAYLYVEGLMDLTYGGIPIIRVPLLPNDMSICYSGSVSPADGTFIWLTTRFNFLLAIHRKIRYERERRGCDEQTLNIFSMRGDAKFAQPDAVVTYDCLHVCPC